jgi:nucleotide-binding universal stress UspA family protein
MTYGTPPAYHQPYVILVGLAFDRTGEQALWEAARLAELHPASELHVVHVVPEIGPATPTRELVSIERRLEQAPAMIGRYIGLVWPNMQRKVTAHVRVGPPSRAILRTAAAIHAELVVVGTHRRSGMKKLVLGSVAEQVLRHAHCPVFVAMPKDYAASNATTRAPAAPCPRCIALRQQSYGAQFWCEEHSRPAVKRPSQRARKSPDRLEQS